ncbi:MAG: zinc ribbon domain-containing protein [bacterium]|nr:zinc ribbon domain-containing protein [bacterium]
MFCGECGKEISIESKFCVACGNKNNSAAGMLIQSIQNVVKNQAVVHPEPVQLSEADIQQANRYRRKGLLWIIIPWVGLVGILFLWSIARFILTQT